MLTIKQLLELCKTKTGAATDTALADALGVTRGAVYNWKKGLALPDEVACSRIAEITGEPLARVLGVVGEARALSKEAKAVWRRLATAAALLLLVGAAGAPSPAAAQGIDFTDISRPMYIMSIG